jgi:hypothetical protein
LGSDIDPCAVEWTIRLLFLTVWESCLADGIQPACESGLRMPDLRKNIVCCDFLDDSGEQAEALAPWKDRKPNAIVGAPPFVRIQDLHRTQPHRVLRYREIYRTARSGQFDLYMLFMEKAIELLADGGRLGLSSTSAVFEPLIPPRVGTKHWRKKGTPAD